jgi:membrane fusion protein, multidrug efflux system
MKKRAKHLAAALAALTALAVGLPAAGCGGNGGDETAAPPAEPGAAERSALPADVSGVAAELESARGGAAAPGPLDPAEGTPAAAAISATGELVSPVRSELVARMPGRVAAVLADEGDVVEKGRPLLRLETEYLRPELARAEADLARARAAVAQAESDFRRKEELLQRGSIPQALYDRSKGEFDQARAAEGSAAAAAALAGQRLRDAVVVAPMSGVVAERRVDVGERLADNTAAFVLMQLSPLRLRFALPERHLSEVRPGQTVEARVDPYPNEVFTGRVVMIGKVVDPATRTFAVEAELPNRDRRLTPGLFARVEVRRGEPRLEEGPSEE